MKVESPEVRKIVLISFAHLVNDWYMNYIQTLLPFLVMAGLGVAKGAFLISAFTITSSLLQPFFGYLVDQKNMRWLVFVGTVWMSIFLCLVGLLKNYPLLLIISALAGLGTAAFHPQASAMVTLLSGHKKGFFQACFIAAGNIGWALTPLMVMPFVQTYGLAMTPVFVIPGAIVAVLLWFYAPRGISATRTPAQSLKLIFSGSGLELTKVIAVVALRSVSYFGLIAFLPFYLLQTAHISLLDGSRLLFVMLFSAAIGGVIGGYLADRFNGKLVLVATLIIASPMFYLFLHTNGLLSYIWLAVAGATLQASSSVTVVLAQEIIHRNEAMASGLILGFGVGMGGLGVGLLGLVAEYLKMADVVSLLIWLPLLAGLLGLLLKRSKAVLSTGSGISNL